MNNPEEFTSHLRRLQSGVSVRNASRSNFTEPDPWGKDCIHELGRMGLNIEPLTTIERAGRFIGKITNKVVISTQRWLTTKK